MSYRSGDMISPALPEQEPLREVVEEFGACIRTGRHALDRRSLRAAGAGYP